MEADPSARWNALLRQSERAESEERIRKLQADVAAAQQTLQTERLSSKSENDALRSKIAALEAKCAELRQDAQVAGEVQQMTAERCFLLESEIKGLKDEEAALLSQLCNSNVKLEDERPTKADDSAIAEELAALRQANRELKQQNEALLSNLADEQVRASSLQHELRAELEAERQQKADELAAVEKEMEEVKRQKNALLSKIAELEPRTEKAEPSVFPQELWSMQQTGVLTDFALVVDGEKIPVHRNVLASKSAFFAAFFHANPTQTKHAIEDLPLRVVQRMVEFVYCGELPAYVLKEDARKLYAAARRFEISGLIAACTDAIKAGITNENVADLLVAAVRNDDHELAAIAMDFAETNGGGKTSLLLAEPVLWLVRNDQVTTYEKIVRLLKQDTTMDHSALQQAPQSSSNSAEDPSISPSSNEWECVDFS